MDGKTILNSTKSSLKLLKKGNGSYTMDGKVGAGKNYALATIPHGYGSSKLLFQVSSSSGYVAGTILPWESNDGRFLQYAKIDANNLYILGRFEDSGGAGWSAFNVDFSYRIYIP
jgi:hypothetical protein